MDEITIAELEAEALRRWQAWAEDLAAGRPPPHPHALLEAGVILRIKTPGQALEAAAEAARARVSAERLAY